MASTVKSRPNYYELLGLQPGASSDAIAREFARQSNVLRPHVFGGLADLCLAYETLRDPIRRRAYDESLGLTPRPDSRGSSAPPSGWRLPGSVSGGAAKLANTAPRPPATPALAPTQRTELAAERNPKLFDVPLPRLDTRDKGPAVRPPPESPPRTEAGAKPHPHPALGDYRSVQLALDEGLIADIRPIEWRRTGGVVGGLLAAAILLGGLAGWWSGSEAAEPEQAKRSASTELKPEKKIPGFDELWPAPAPRAVEARPDRPRRAVTARPRVERTPDLPRLPAAVAEPQQDQSPPGATDLDAVDPLALEAPSGPAVAAKLPLPDRTVARTIDRIGYACGKVTSTIAVEGESPGVYKVTCTSGQSYQARPVSGRYRFRRWGRD